jgi:hypothetical protein
MPLAEFEPATPASDRPQTFDFYISQPLEWAFIKEQRVTCFILTLPNTDQQTFVRILNRKQKILLVSVQLERIRST